LKRHEYWHSKRRFKPEWILRPLKGRILESVSRS
jgi:hypothetical protein